ncbi:MAG TPA: alpha/beta hydrolase [Solirubrobacteraceae bacterium]
MGPNQVDEHTFTLDATGPIFYRSAPAAGTPPLYLHGIPTSSDDWIACLERTGGLAPDLIGFGRSSKGGHLDYSPCGLSSFVERLLDELGVQQVSLVAHQWGAVVGALLAARQPERVERITLLNPLPLIAGFRWQPIARWWLRPLVGELIMGSTTKGILSRTLRRGTLNPEAWTPERLAAVWEQFDQGTQRAILRLHRGTPEAALEGVLSELRMPVSVIWGDRDPWLAPELGDAYAARFDAGTIEHLEAGHWPWLDRPELVDRIAQLAAP